MSDEEVDPHQGVQAMKSPAGGRVDPLTTTVALALMRHPAVGRNRVYAAINSGALCSVSVGKRTAILISDLDEWVQDGCPTTPMGTP